MSNRWQHKVVEVPYKMFVKLTERIQTELDQHSLKGWELVSVTHPGQTEPVRLFFRKPA